jgi:hypothetical protein
MKTNFYNLPLQILLSIFFIWACNEPEPDQITVRAEIPEVITFLDADSFKFEIESFEAKIDSVQLFEGNTKYVALGVSQFGADMRSLKLNFLYAPNSTGTKQFTLKVNAPPYRENYSFAVEVIE